MTRFTQDLLSTAKFGEFSVYHHSFGPEAPEDVVGASVEQPWPAQVTKDTWAGPEQCLWFDFHTITVSESFWRASPLSKTKPLTEASSARQFMECFYPKLRAGGLAVFVLGNVCTFG